VSSETTDDTGADAEESMAERGSGDTRLSYLLVGADRRLVTVGLLVGMFLAFVLAAVVLPGSAAVVRSGDPVETLFQALVGATVTGVTLVLTLNQLVLSQELGAVGDQRERMTGAMEFRIDVADHLTDPVAPAEPSAFLRAMVAAAGDQADRLREAVDEGADDEARRGARDLADGVVTSADGVTTSLSGATFGRYDVVAAALDFEYSRKLYRTRQLRETYGDRLPDEAADALAELEELLRLFGPAREHFKTLYFRSELVHLSQLVLFVALPALVVTVAMLAFYDATAVPATTLLGIDGAVLVVCAATALALGPFLVLLSYVLRIATIAGQTLSIGPFILRETDREATTGSDDG
jgi:CBS domain-containing protein